MKKLITLLLAVVLFTACDTTPNPMNSVQFSQLQKFQQHKADTVLIIGLNQPCDMPANVLIRKNMNYYKAQILSGTDRMANFTLGELFFLVVLVYIGGGVVGFFIGADSSR